MTTNFDFLIEYALLQLGTGKDEILPVITKADYQNYSSPKELLSEGKKTLYKIHGSTKNIVSEENTKDSLVTTIQALGSHKVGENVFQVEPFKRLLFENNSNGRYLVVMGYSGSDDFDIVPTLKVLKNLRNIIWINYSQNINMGREKIHEIDSNTDRSLDKLDKNLRKITQILLEIRQENHADHVYRVDVNTTEMVKNLLKSKLELSSTNFFIESGDWLENNIKVPDIMMKYYIPYRIYDDFGFYDDALRCSKKILLLAKKSKNEHWKASVLNNMGEIYRAQGSYLKALKRFEEALKIAEQLGDLSYKVTFLNNIGRIYYTQGSYPEALKHFEEALQIAEELGDSIGKAIRLNNIGNIYHDQGNYPEAFKRYEEAMQTDEQLENLREKATCFNNIGAIYDAQGSSIKKLSRF